jgi:O-antigen/teichoic acid export membrane protein
MDIMYETTRKIAHNTVVQMAGKIVSTGLGLVAIGMMTRYLGAEQFGWYVTAISFLQFIGILTDFGLIPVSAQMLSEPGYEKQTLLKNLLGFRLATAIIFLGIPPVIALFFPYPIEVKITIAFSTISFLSVAINQILTGYLQTQLRMQVYALGEIIGCVVLVVGLFVFMSQNASFLPIMLVLVSATIASAI